MSATRWLMLFLPLGLATQAHSQTLHNVNASAIGTGVGRNINWTTEGQQNPIWCGTACNYLEVATAKIAPKTGLAYLPAGWPSAGSTSFPDPSHALDYTLTPTDEEDSLHRPIVYESSNWERAAVDPIRTGGHSLIAKVYKTGDQPSGQNGTAATALAYHVRVRNMSTEGRDYFIRFKAPKSLRSTSIAYNIGGPSQNQPMPVEQQYGKSRSAVDVLVDGLPIWSTASNYIYPSDYSADPYGGFRTEWGSESDDDQYTIFIGRFESNAIFNLDFIVRADAVARGPTCGKVTEPMTLPNPRVLMHCYLVAEGRSLPPLSSDDFFEVYSKVVSTPILTIPGGNLPPL